MGKNVRVREKERLGVIADQLILTRLTLWRNKSEWTAERGILHLAKDEQQRANDFDLTFLSKLKLDSIADLNLKKL